MSENKFAANIKLLRENRGLNQADMLDCLGFARARWSSYETGLARPNLDDLIKIAEFFNTTETDILHGDLQKSYTPVVKKALDDGKPSKKSEDIEVLRKLIAYQEEEIATLKKQLKEKTSKR